MSSSNGHYAMQCNSNIKTFNFQVLKLFILLLLRKVKTWFVYETPALALFYTPSSLVYMYDISVWVSLSRCSADFLTDLGTGCWIFLAVIGHLFQLCSSVVTLYWRAFFSTTFLHTKRLCLASFDHPAVGRSCRKREVSSVYR